MMYYFVFAGLFFLCPRMAINVSVYNMLSVASNRGIGEVVLDGGGRFSPAGIVGVHTLSLLLSSQAAHDRAAVDSHIQDKSRLRN